MEAGLGSSDGPPSTSLLADEDSAVYMSSCLSRSSAVRGFLGGALSRGARSLAGPVGTPCRGLLRIGPGPLDARETDQRKKIKDGVKTRTNLGDAVFGVASLNLAASEGFCTRSRRECALLEGFGPPRGPIGVFSNLMESSWPVA